MNHLLQAELALTRVEQVGFGEQVGVTRLEQSRRTDMAIPGKIFSVKLLEGLEEQPMQSIQKGEGADETSSMSSRYEGEETMDAD